MENEIWERQELLVMINYESYMGNLNGLEDTPVLSKFHYNHAIIFC
jgi:hypothetical protein